MRGEPVPDNMEVDIIGKMAHSAFTSLLQKKCSGMANSSTRLLYNDITERKRAEEALKASEEKYSTLIEQSSDRHCYSQ